MVINVLVQDEGGGDPDQDDLVEWATLFDLTMPVVADPGMGYMLSFLPGATSVAFPTSVVLDRGVVVDEVGMPTIEDAVRLAGQAE